jgi:hypothetical protein
MPRDAFFEIILPSDAGDEEPAGRWEVEDALDEALSDAGVGEVTGGGTGVGQSVVDVEVTDFDRALPIIRRVLRELRVPRGVRISHNEGDFIAGTGRRTYYPVYE